MEDFVLAQRDGHLGIYMDGKVWGEGIKEIHIVRKDGQNHLTVVGELPMNSHFDTAEDFKKNMVDYVFNQPPTKR